MLDKLQWFSKFKIWQNLLFIPLSSFHIKNVWIKNVVTVIQCQTFLDLFDANIIGEREKFW